MAMRSPGQGGNKPRPQAFQPDTRPVKTKANETEKRLAKKLGYKQTPNSGALPFLSMKGDGQDVHFVWQDKSVEGGRIVVDKADVTELVRQAKLLGKLPALALTVKDFPDTVPKDWVCFPADVFVEMFGPENRPKKSS